MKATSRSKKPKIVSSNLLKHVVSKHPGKMMKLKDGGIASGIAPKARMDRKSRLVDLDKAGKPAKGSADGDSSPVVNEFPGFKKGGKTKWIQKANLKEGAFTKKANKAGESVHSYAEEKKDASGKTGKQARLALTFEKMAKKKG